MGPQRLPDAEGMAPKPNLSLQPNLSLYAGESPDLGVRMLKMEPSLDSVLALSPSILIRGMRWGKCRGKHHHPNSPGANILDLSPMLGLTD